MIYPCRTSPTLGFQEEIMKKRRLLSFLLALTLLVGTPISVYATETEETVETQPLGAEGENLIATDLAFGSVSILNGCRTIDGNMPLAGSDRKCETAQSVMIFERTTGTVVYSYNPDVKMPAGSLMKILTALLVIEHCPDLEDIVTVEPGIASRVPAGAQTIKLRSEEQLTVNDLLHCMILQSANDAAIALAEHVAGTQTAFITMMNDRCKAIGCTNTSIGSVHGLGSSNQYTTARDMARIVEECTKNETFCELFAAQSYTVPETNLSDARKFASQNYLMETTIVPKYNDLYVTGGFASYSESLGASIVCTSKTPKSDTKGTMDLVCVLLGASRQFNPEKTWQVTSYGNFEEILKILQYVYKNFKVVDVIYANQALRQFQVMEGESDVVGAPDVSITSVLPIDVQMDNLIKNYDVVGGGLTAPVAKGDNIANVEIWYRNSCVLETPLYAMSNVRTKDGSGLTISHGVTKEETSGGSRTLLTVCLCIILPIMGYLIINQARRSRAAYRRKRKKRNENWY